MYTVYAITYTAMVDFPQPIKPVSRHSSYPPEHISIIESRITG